MFPAPASKIWISSEKNLILHLATDFVSAWILKNKEKILVLFETVSISENNNIIMLGITLSPVSTTLSRLI